MVTCLSMTNCSEKFLPDSHQTPANPLTLAKANVNIEVSDDWLCPIPLTGRYLQLGKDLTVSLSCKLGATERKNGLPAKQPTHLHAHCGINRCSQYMMVVCSKGVTRPITS